MLYIVVTALWGIFFIAWFLNFVIIRVCVPCCCSVSVCDSSRSCSTRKQHVVKLHISISVFIVIKLVSVIYLMLYWLEMDKIGTVDASVVFGYYAVKIMFVLFNSLTNLCLHHLHDCGGFGKQQRDVRLLQCAAAHRCRLGPVSYTHLTLPTNSLV